MVLIVAAWIAVAIKAAVSGAVAVMLEKAAIIGTTTNPDSAQAITAPA